MPNYFSQTENAPMLELDDQTNSGFMVNETVQQYKFSTKPIVNFMTVGYYEEEDIISKETEKKFYEEAFKTDVA